MFKLAEDNLSHTMIETLLMLLELEEITMPHVFMVGDVAFLSSHKHTLVQQGISQTVEL